MSLLSHGSLRLFLNTTPHKWILKKRLQIGYKLLVETSKNISDVSLETGFEDLAHFSKAFKKEYGQSPSEVKQKDNEKDVCSYFGIKEYLVYLSLFCLKNIVRLYF